MSKLVRKDEVVAGIILVVIGLLILISNLFGINVWFVLFTYWPVIFIIIGAWVIIRNWRQ